MSNGCESDVTATAVLRHAATVSVEDLDGELLAYEDTAKKLYAFNGTATLLWQCLDSESSLRDIIDDIADVFEAPPGTVEADVVAAAGQWRSSGLVELLMEDGTWGRTVPPGPVVTDSDKPCVGCAEKAARRKAEAAAARLHDN